MEQMTSTNKWSDNITMITGIGEIILYKVTGGKI